MTDIWLLGLLVRLLFIRNYLINILSITFPYFLFSILYLNLTILCFIFYFVISLPLFISVIILFNYIPISLYI
jgi:hypothetical protein